MEPTKELIDDIYRSKVLRARKSPKEEKFRTGGELFDEVCQRILSGIRSQHPDADDARVKELLRRNFTILRRLRAYDGEP